MAYFVPCLCLLLVACAADDSTFSFLAIGDWGDSSHLVGEESVASAMNAVAAEHGTQFVASVGDNFYSAGVTSISDPLWQKNWLTAFTGRWVGGAYCSMPACAASGSPDAAS
jgi:hypothetical protein